MEDFDGKVALITGAAGSIGGALARLMARAGLALVLTDIHAAGLAKIGDEISAQVRVLPHVADLTDKQQVQALVDAAYREFDRVDVLINNAAVSLYAPVWDLPAPVMQWMLDVNVMGPFYMMQAVVPRMIAAGTKGHVVNVASMAGVVGAETLGGYSASKHALVGLTDSLRADLAAVGAPIGVSLIAPGPVTNARGLSAMRPQIDRHAEGELAEQMHAILDTTEEKVAAGIAPEVVAELVLLAIRENLFWIPCPPALEGAFAMRAGQASRDRQLLETTLAKENRS